MIRTVIDPGVLIAALLSRDGAPAAVVRACIEGRIEVITSPALLDELGSVLEREKFRQWITLAEVDEYVQLIRSHGLCVDDPPTRHGFTRDPDDDYLVSLAREVRAHVLVSGDSDLLDMAMALPPVITPRQLLDMIAD